MPRRAIDTLRDAVRTGNYDLTFHAVESAILSGKIIKKEKDDPRGIKFVNNGVGIDQSTSIEVVGRFKETGTFLIITGYKIIEFNRRRANHVRL